ncbi:MAG: glycosyltransferase family 4 protein [Acidimicrobiales bacterium]
MTDRYPSNDNGHGIRTANIIDGLVQVGSVHVCLIDSSVDGVHPPSHPRFTSTVIRAHEWPRWIKPAWALSRRPAGLRYRHVRALREQVIALNASQAPWDLIWCSRARVHTLTQSLIYGPRIVDFDDLNDRLLRSVMRDRRDRFGRLRAGPRNVIDGLGARAWRLFQQRIATEAERVVVCSAQDRDYLAVSNATVVPNGYPLPRSSSAVSAELVNPRTRPGGPPSLLFVGALTYEPNRLAVKWIIDEVLPRIRPQVPDISFIVVGNHEGVSFPGMHASGVSYQGRVDDVAPYYKQATVAVTPIHSGGGTRLKVIEAFAHRVPLVSTSFGFEGLDVRPGRDLLVADDPAMFASSCVAVIKDDDYRRRLVESAFERYHARLTASATSDAVRKLAADILTMDHQLSRV